MSDDRERLDLRAHIARIDRDIAETRKLDAERGKVLAESEQWQREQITRIDRAIAETHKFQAETNKLTEEAYKFKREPWLAIVVALAAWIGALIGSLPNWLRFL